MRIERLFNTAAVPGGTFNHTVSRGHVNGLIVSSGWSFNNGDRITVQRRTDRKTHILASAFPMMSLLALSGLENGLNSQASNAVGELVLQLAGEHADATEYKALTEGEYNAFISRVGRAHGQYFYIPLGSLYLGKDSELDLEFVFGGSRGANQTIDVYAVRQGDLRPDVMLQYVQTTDLERHYANTDGIFVARRDLAPLDQLTMSGGVVNQVFTDFDVYLEEQGESATLVDSKGVLAATNLFSKSEFTAQSHILQIYKSPDGLPRQVFCRISGANQGDIQLTHRLFLYDQPLVSRNTAEELDKLLARVEKLEREQPELAKALRHSGQVAKSEDLAAASAEVKKSNQADGIVRAAV